MSNPTDTALGHNATPKPFREVKGLGWELKLYRNGAATVTFAKLTEASDTTLFILTDRLKVARDELIDELEGE